MGRFYIHGELYYYEDDKEEPYTSDDLVLIILQHESKILEKDSAETI